MEYSDVMELNLMLIYGIPVLIKSKSISLHKSCKISSYIKARESADISKAPGPFCTKKLRDQSSLAAIYLLVENRVLFLVYSWFIASHYMLKCLLFQLLSHRCGTCVYPVKYSVNSLIIIPGLRIFPNLTSILTP